MIELIGKCPPSIEESDMLYQNGFDSSELYTTKSHLENVEETRAVCEQMATTVSVVHTPHVTASEMAYLEAAALLAEQLDALLLVHSAHISMKKACELFDTIPYENIAFENGSERTTQIRNISREDRNIVLDVAHLYLTNPHEFASNFESLLADSQVNIAHVHVCDADPETDHLQLTDGAIPLDCVKKQLLRHYNGTMTLELMPALQPETKRIYTELPS